MKTINTRHFYAGLGASLVPMKAWAVKQPLLDGVRFWAYRNADLGGWVCVEHSTGLSLGHGRTRREAIEEAKWIIQERGASVILEAIEIALKEHGRANE